MDCVFAHIIFIMPNYTYHCNDCNQSFELFFHIKNYNSAPLCINCNSNNTCRDYMSDVITQISSIKKHDSELKTIGDLAKRNSDKFSHDYKVHLYQKHNDYKFDNSNQKDLPSGMSRIKKPQKPVWPGSKNTKKKRKPKNG